ncbi:hypothetical protein [Formosa haliotis]|uniref:hypothetical protein n=1 Tax=Formosa haliotis TaxID=1555194 RepID=UPI0008260F65|nr:hypothetical protein [Formosa haliotis]
MKNIAKIFYLCLIIQLYGCGFGDWDVTLYEQKIEDSSNVIYEFDAWGGLDSHSAGYVIMDSTKQFKVNSARKLPIYYLTSLPNKRKIKAIGLKNQ